MIFLRALRFFVVDFPRSLHVALRRPETMKNVGQDGVLSHVFGGAMNIKFSPAQQGAFDNLSRLLKIGNVIVLYGAIGAGKSTVLGEIHRRTGGAFLGVRSFVEAMRGRHPLSMEETFEQMVMEAISASDTVIVDDLNLLNDVVCCGHFYPRAGFLNAPLTTLTAYAAEAGKRLIFGSANGVAGPVHQRAFRGSCGGFKAAA